MRKSLPDETSSETARPLKVSAASGAEPRRFIPLPPETGLLKRFWYRCLSPSYRDPRNGKRDGLSWLAAYFFTGGTPEPYRVRDVSPTGIYLLTGERWSVGTILRLSLTDPRQPTPDRSLTVNARVMRWGKDGMGLKFVPYDLKTKNRDWSVGDDLVATSKDEIKKFLDRMRNLT